MTLETVWQSKGSSVRTFAHARAIVDCTSSAIRSLDPKTGKQLAKIKWNRCGEPWIDGDVVWIPTTKGYNVVDVKTLETKRTVATPKPKGAASALAFYGTFDRVIAGTSYRIAKTNAETLEIFLQALDIASGKQRYATCVATTKPIGYTSCAATMDRLVVAYIRDKTGTRHIVSLTDGSVIATQPLVAPKDLHPGRALSPSVKAFGPHLIAFPSAHVKPEVLDGTTWKPLAFDGEIEAIAEQIYGVGHRQIVRFDHKLGIAAKLELDSPPRDDLAMYGPDASLLSVGKDLVMAWRASVFPDAPPYTVQISVQRADPASLKLRGKPATMKAAGISALLGSVDDILIFSGPQGLLAVRGDW